MSNWFLAAEPDDPLLVALHDAFLKLWRTTVFSRQDKRLGQALIARISPVLNRDHRRTQLWLNPVFLRLARVHPYFVFHYTFNKLMLRDASLRANWETSAAYDAAPMHTLQHLAPLPDGEDQALAALADTSWPLQKLDWRVEIGHGYWNGVHAALEARNVEAALRSRPVA